MAQKSEQEILNTIWNNASVNSCGQTVSAAGATVVWTPVAGRSIYLTNAAFSSVSAGSIVQLYGGGAKLTGNIYLAAGQFENMSFPTPLKLSANQTLGVSSQAAALTVGVTFVGYEM